jgi:hypothetical protein
MAHSKTANAQVVNRDLALPVWEKRRVRVASLGGQPSPDLLRQASDIFDTQFNPRDFLLTHATIVASVDTLDVPGKLGVMLVNGQRINRRYANYRVKTECDKFINNNDDAWERRVLLAAYPTFIGAHNFVEHVQIEDQSKGRIIDAVARDIGPSVYTDILIATRRDFGPLIADINSGRMATLSMGCTVDETQCTKCGHVAADETEMCPCIKYEKGNYFYDSLGVRHRIAELCGHRSLEPTGGVVFIEASWVQTPAFSGAVLRNVIEPDEAMDRKVVAVLSKPPKRWSNDDRQKAAAVERFGQAPTAMLGGFRKDDDEGGEEEAPADDAVEADPLDDIAKKLEQQVLDSVTEKLEKQIRERGVSEALNPGHSSMEPNDNLVKWAAGKRVYVASLRALASTSTCDAALLNTVASYNKSLGFEVSVPVYRAALRVGSVKRYASKGNYLEACTRAFGRRLSRSEHRIMLALCSLLSYRGDPSAEPIGGQR